MPTYDNILISGDFNIHVCCPSNHLASEFLCLLNSFDLSQSVHAPTHQFGHTLDLIISHGSPVSLREISQTCISDHFPILFDFSAPPPASRPITTARRQRIITSTTAAQFATAFTAVIQNTEAGVDPFPCPDDIVSSFHSICSDIMDNIAPYRFRSCKSKQDPWLKEHTRALRQSCRKAERRHNKDKLQVSLEILRESLLNYQKAVREAKCQYLSNVVSTSSNNPRVLFNTIQSVINPPGSALKNVSNSTCDMF